MLQMDSITNNNTWSIKKKKNLLFQNPRNFWKKKKKRHTWKTGRTSSDEVNTKHQQ